MVLVVVALVLGYFSVNMKSLGDKKDLSVGASPPEEIIAMEEIKKDDFAMSASPTFNMEETAPPTTFTSGNSKISKVTIGEGSDGSMSVRSHSYNVINSSDALLALENTTTYVLLPRNLSGHSNQNTVIYKRYLQVLELIQELKKVNKSIPRNSISRKHENEFILFTTGEVDKKVTVENYNYELSHEVLDFFQEKYPSKLFRKDGPYFITTAKNVLTSSDDFSFLYVNLSKFNNSSVKEVIESYKQRLLDKGDSDIGLLESWRYTLLSALTTLNNDIHIFQTAVAGE